MGRKKKFIVELKPFCFYCDKEFNNEVILHQHQKAKHFSCKECKKRFSTAPALETHMLQVHRHKIHRVPNSKTGRDTFDISIYGMDGVPLDLINIKLQEKINKKKRKLIKSGEDGIEINQDVNDKAYKDNKRRGMKEEKVYIFNKDANFYQSSFSVNLAKKNNYMGGKTNNAQPMNFPMMPMMGFMRPQFLNPMNQMPTQIQPPQFDPQQIAFQKQMQFQQQGQGQFQGQVPPPQFPGQINPYMSAVSNPMGGIIMRPSIIPMPNSNPLIPNDIPVPQGCMPIPEN